MILLEKIKCPTLHLIQIFKVILFFLNHNGIVIYLSLHKLIQLFFTFHLLYLAKIVIIKLYTINLTWKKI